MSVCVCVCGGVELRERGVTQGEARQGLGKSLPGAPALVRTFSPPAGVLVECLIFGGVLVSPFLRNESLSGT